MLFWELPSLRRLSLLTLTNHLSSYGLFIFETLFFGIFPQIAGFIMREIFDTLTYNAPIGLNIYTLIALLVANAAAKAIAIFTDVWIYFNFRWSVAALLRVNLFTFILKRPGAHSLPESPGEAVSRFRGDVDEIAFFLSESLILVGFGTFTAIALIVMLRTAPLITLVILIALISVIIIANLSTKAAQKYREASREAAGKVTGFIGELFGAAQAVQVACSEDQVINQLATIYEIRKNTAVKDRLFGELLRTIFQNAGNIGTGLVLLLVGNKMASGNFTVGDFAIFVYYLGHTADFAGMIGEYLAWNKQVGVSMGRLFHLLQGAPSGTIVEHNKIFLHDRLPEVPFNPKRDEHFLEVLEAKGLTYHYHESKQGISDIDITLPKGSFVVITGQMGSGKTTLIRTLLGLLPPQAGKIYWNSQPIDDPGKFLIPPRIAYVPQIPILFSESLKDNILMGLPEDAIDLDKALYQAVLEKDVSEFEVGLDTVLGAKGVKLSGGQRQRTAAARMFVRDPELLVFDDISSALDVETEKLLWERVFKKAGATCLAVSYSKTALSLADHVIVLRGGKIEAEGKLEDLLRSNVEMQTLWRGEIGKQVFD